MRNDFDAGAARRALAREGAAYLAQALLYGFGFINPRHKPERRPDIRTVVFLHGLGANRASVFPLQAYLRCLGHTRQYSFNLKAGTSVEEMALRVKRQLDANVRGGSIDIVGHSLGGVVGRYYVQALGGHRRVRNLVTLASPHLGTHSWVYVPTKLVAQLRPGSSFMQHLQSLPVPPGVRLTSIAGMRDLIVVPGEHALAPFGEQRTFPELGHLDMLFSPRVLQAVHEALSTPSAIEQREIS